MTLAAAGDLYSAKINWSLHGQAVICVLHFLAEGTPDIEGDLALGVRQDVQNQYNLYASQQLVHTNVQVQRLSPTLGVPFIDSSGDVAAKTGDVAQQSVPAQVAVVVQLRSGTGGRSARGRFYLPGMPVTALNVGMWATLPDLFINSLVAHFVTSVAASRWRMVVLSRKLAGSSLPLNSAGIFPVTALTMDVVPGTLRSRRIGKGS